MTAQVAADLRAAADLIEQGGWVQGRSTLYDEGTDTTSYCLVGAMRTAAGGYHHSDSISERYGRMYHRMVLAVRTPAAWNDSAGRTAAEVIAALRAAADKADES